MHLRASIYAASPASAAKVWRGPSIQKSRHAPIFKCLRGAFEAGLSFLRPLTDRELEVNYTITVFNSANRSPLGSMTAFGLHRGLSAHPPGDGNPPLGVPPNGKYSIGVQ